MRITLTKTVFNRRQSSRRFFLAYVYRHVVHCAFTFFSGRVEEIVSFYRRTNKERCWLAEIRVSFCSHSAFFQPFVALGWVGLAFLCSSISRNAYGIHDTRHKGRDPSEKSSYNQSWTDQTARKKGDKRNLPLGKMWKTTANQISSTQRRKKLKDILQ